MADRLDMSDRVVLVTGGARGIGRGIAETFLAAGADVVICGRTEPETLPDGRRHAARRSSPPTSASPTPSTRWSPTTVDRFGRLDVLVNNAGGSPPADSATVSPKFSRAIIELNLLAPLVCAQRANAVMQEPGRRAARSSTSRASAGCAPTPSAAAYGAAKAGLLNLTQTLAVEYAPKVRVNAVTRRAHPHRAGPPLLRRRGGHRGRRRDRAARAHGPAGRHRRRLPLPRVAARRVRRRARTSSCTAAASAPPTSTPRRPDRAPPRAFGRPVTNERDAAVRTRAPRTEVAASEPWRRCTRSRCCPATRSAAASAIVRADARFPEGATFVHVVLHEPDKADAGGRHRRAAPSRSSSSTGPGLGVIEVVVVARPTAPSRSWDVVEGVRPTLLFGEAMHAIFTTKEHPEYIAALARRGITDVDNVQIDPWPAGVFGYDAEDRPAHRPLHLVPAHRPAGQRLRPARSRA